MNRFSTVHKPKKKTAWSNSLNKSLCFLQTRSFSLYKSLIDGLETYGLLVDYCDAFISCVDSHSDWHPFTAEDPFVSKWYAKFLQICSDEETNWSWMAWGWVYFHFCVNYSFNATTAKESLIERRHVLRARDLLVLMRNWLETPGWSTSCIALANMAARISRSVKTAWK